MRKYHTVIFDLDGTLLDSKNGFWHCFETALTRLGYPNPHIDVTVGNSTVSLQIEGRGIVSGEQTVPYASFGMSPGNEATLHVSPRNAKLRFIRVHPSNARAATYLRDVRGNIVEIVDEGGATVYYEYNPLGELVAIRDGDGALLSEQALDRGAGGKR